MGKYTLGFSTTQSFQPVILLEKVHDEVSDTRSAREHITPTSKAQSQKAEKDSGIMVGNVLGTRPDAKSAKVEEVSASLLPNTDVTCTTTKVGPKTRGSVNSVAPDTHRSVTSGEVLITRGSSNNRGILSGNQYVPSVLCDKTIGPMALSDPSSKEVLSKALCYNNPRCEKLPDHDKNDNKSVLLFDINHSGDTDKWLNVTVPKRVQALLDGQKVTNCALFSQWRKQSEFDFGFIPLSDFKAPPNENINNPPQSPLQVHHQIKSTGVLNFVLCRIPIESQLCMDEWQAVLKGYWDTQLIDLLRFGFPLDFNRNSSLKCDSRNHSLATDFPLDVEAYLKEEIEYGAILGPFVDCPISQCHKSQFMTREKPNSTHRHVIVDLSWPKGASVNTGVCKDSYLGTDFVLSLPTIDHITSRVRALGPGTHLYNIDISRAFRHIKIDPGDLDLLGMSWNDATYIDTCLPLGSRHGSQIFQRVSDAVHHVMRQHSYAVVNYVDDFIGIAMLSIVRRSYVFLQDLLVHLGLDVSQ